MFFTKKEYLELFTTILTIVKGFKRKDYKNYVYLSRKEITMELEVMAKILKLVLTAKCINSNTFGLKLLFQTYKNGSWEVEGAIKLLIEFYFANCQNELVISEDNSTAQWWYKKVLTRIEEVFKLVCFSDEATSFAIKYSISLSNKLAFLYPADTC